MQESIESEQPLMKQSDNRIRLLDENQCESQDSPQHGPNNEHGSRETIKHGFRYLHMVLKICGLVFDKQDSVKLRYVFQVVVFSLLLSVSWLNVVRYIFAYRLGERFSWELIVKILMHTIYILAALAHTSFIPVLLKLPAVLTTWQHYHDRYSVPCAPIIQNIRKNSIKAIVMWLVAVPTVGTIQLLEQYTDSPFGLYSYKPITEGYKHLREVPGGTMAVAVLLYAQNTTVILLSIFSFITIACALKQEFELLEIDSKIEPQELEMLRQRHIQLSSIVSDMNKIVSPFILIIFVCSVPALCFNLYLLVVWNLSVPYKLLLSGNVLLEVTMVFTVIVVGARINVQACSLRTALYKIDLSNDTVWTQQHIAKLQIFLQFLSEGKIGFTAWNLFYLKHDTIQMVTLWLITYTAVMVRFGSGEVTMDEDQFSQISNETLST